MLQNLKKSISYFIPSTCLLCEMENEQLICSACSHQFFSSTTNRCVSCALPIFIHDTHCGACLKNPPAFDSTFVACDYVAPFDQLVLSLKFGHRTAVASAIADLLAKVVVEELPDLLIAVPLSRQRLAQRGFNQALEIAKPLAHKLDRPVYANLLHRVRDTQAQTLLHPNQRHENILHAFSLNEDYADKIRGQHIGVVDDVMTTGATLHEVARCLKKHGATRVSNIVFARTPPH
jgi:ComF family protein